MNNTIANLEDFLRLIIVEFGGILFSFSMPCFSNLRVGPSYRQKLYYDEWRGTAIYTLTSKAYLMTGHSIHMNNLSYERIFRGVIKYFAGCDETLKYIPQGHSLSFKFEHQTLGTIIVDPFTSYVPNELKDERIIILTIPERVDYWKRLKREVYVSPDLYLSKVQALLRDFLDDYKLDFDTDYEEYLNEVAELNEKKSMTFENSLRTENLIECHEIQDY